MHSNTGRDVLNLNTEQLSYIEQRLGNDKKSGVVAYALWFFVGWFGAHRFYFGKNKIAIFFIALSLISIFTWFFLVGIATAIILVVWVLVDAFLIPNWIEADTQEKRERLIEELAQTTAIPEEPDT